MRSTSTHQVVWLKPEIAEEQWEFFHHPAKQDYYLRQGIDWEHLLAACDRGRLVPYPRSNRLMGMPVALSYDSYDDYAKYLAKAKRGYRKSYAKMEEELQRSGTLTVKAPIIVRCDGEALLFSGYRRLCLAWNYGMVPYVWLVTVR
jgi:hypothetical protein